MTKAQRREHNQKIAADMKARGEERRTARCPVCNKLVRADFLKAGMATHRCDAR